MTKSNTGSAMAKASKDSGGVTQAATLQFKEPVAADTPAIRAFLQKVLALGRLPQEIKNPKTDAKWQRRS